MVSATDGSDIISGTPTVYYTIDGGAQGTGSGAKVHEGNGQWSYVPAQAETNGDHVAFTMVLASAISQTVNVWPVSFDPTDSVRIGLTALPAAAADAAGGLAISDAGGLDLDAILADVTGLNGDAMRGTNSAATAVALATVDTVVDAIKVVTDNLPDSGALNDLALILSDTGTDGVVISATTANQLADALLNRDFSSVSDTNARTTLNALRFLRNKWSIAGTTLTVTEEDDSTAAWTATVSTDAAADPVTGSDPA